MLYTALYMPGAIRTQIYLTADQRRRLDELARQGGVSLARIIRDAVDGYLQAAIPDEEAALAATFGSLPDLEVPPREEWDRY